MNKEVQSIPGAVQKFIDDFKYFSPVPPWHNEVNHEVLFHEGIGCGAEAMYLRDAPEIAALKAQRDAYRRALERIAAGLPAGGRWQSRRAVALDHQETAHAALTLYPSPANLKTDNNG